MTVNCKNSWYEYFLYMIISFVPHTDSWILAPPVVWQHCDGTGQNFLSRQKITIRHFPINRVFVTRFQFCPGLQIYDERQKRTTLEVINSILPVLVQATGEEENSGITMTRWSVEFLNSQGSARFSKALAAAKVPISNYNKHSEQAPLLIQAGMSPAEKTKLCS